MTTDNEYPTNYDLAEELLKSINRVRTPEPEVETEEDSIKTEAVRRERVRRMVQETISRRSRATPTDKSEEPQAPTPPSSE